jgi:hypothetical protein
MAIAYDTVTGTASPNTGGGPITFSHTCSGSNRALIVYVSSVDSNVPATVTYNGVSMTRIVISGGSEPTSLWFLANPASGSNTVSVSWSGTFKYVRAGAISYTGVKQSGNPTISASNFNNSSVTSLSQNITPTVANCWIVGALFKNGTSTPTPNSGLTKRNASSGDNNTLNIFDTNGTVATSSFSFGGSWTGATYTSLACLVMEEQISYNPAIARRRLLTRR